jgi:hypothetical protein
VVNDIRIKKFIYYVHDDIHMITRKSDD